MEHFEHDEALHEQEKRHEINKDWRDASWAMTMQETGTRLTLRECYMQEVARSKQAFEKVHAVMEQQIPHGTYVLFVDMAHPGFMQRPEVALVDADRLKLVYEAETGSSDVGQDFQVANMRFCFGFYPDDVRFRVVKPFQEALPDDLSQCVGIILSGSETNIKDEKHPERITMTNKVALFVSRAKLLGIPLFGICFGAQLVSSVCKAHIEWIRDVADVAEESGLVLVRKTSAGKMPGSPLRTLPDSFYVHANHTQEIAPDHLPPELQVLASSDTSQVQIVQSKESALILAVQNHIECGDTRADLVADIVRNHQRDAQLFQGESIKAREALCPHFLTMAGSFAQARTSEQRT